MHGTLIGELSIPLFSGAIGYATNWSGVWMLFNPVRFAGVRIPLLGSLATLLPRKIQQIPGIMQGGLGWQGIIPSRAAKMGSIAVDKGIAKLGTPAEFYEQLDPELIADHVLATSEGDIRGIVERTMEREQPQLWHDLPGTLREALHERVRSELPAIVHDIVVDQIGRNIDQLLDVKLMVIRHLEEHPELANRMFRDIGQKELRFIVNFGFFFGFALGVPMIFLTQAFPQWWVLPIAGTLIGYSTNWLAIYMIFEPIEPRRIGRLTWQGLFLKRQPEAAEIYAEIVAGNVVTLSNIGRELLEGPRSDRTRQMIESALRPAVDRATGMARSAVRVAMGTREYDSVRDTVARDAVEYTMTPLSDPEFNRRQSAAVGRLIHDRMLEMSSADFSEMLRSAMREDEWLLVLHGAVLGFFAGLLHYGIFG